MKGSWKNTCTLNSWILGVVVWGAVGGLGVIVPWPTEPGVSAQTFIQPSHVPAAWKIQMTGKMDEAGPWMPARLARAGTQNFVRGRFPSQKHTPFLGAAGWAARAHDMRRHGVSEGSLNPSVYLNRCFLETVILQI